MASQQLLGQAGNGLRLVEGALDGAAAGDLAVNNRRVAKLAALLDVKICFQRAGISSVVCGPGSIDQAHQPNEFIDPAELTRCEAMIDDVFAYLCESG